MSYSVVECSNCVFAPFVKRLSFMLLKKRGQIRSWSRLEVGWVFSGRPSLQSAFFKHNYEQAFCKYASFIDGACAGKSPDLRS